MAVALSHGRSGGNAVEARIDIARTWDGRPLPVHDHVGVWILAEPDRWTVEVEAPFHGDPPPADPPGPTWRLWEHEVVELFVLGPGERYTEIELGPHGHHLALRLEGVRRVVERLDDLDWRVAVAGSRWTGRLSLPAAFLPPPPHRLNATAAWGQGSGRRYASWQPLPGERPDFHRLDRFAAWPPAATAGSPR